MQRSSQIDFDGVENGFIRLRMKPSARLNYSFVPQSSKLSTSERPSRLIVFLSGIDAKRTSWKLMIASLLRMEKDEGLSLPPLLLYDRYGIGMSDQDPTDTGQPREERHDIKNAMCDLRQLVVQISEQKLGYKEAELGRLHLIFVAHSLGAGIARLYAAEFPGTVEALLLLDAVMSNKAFGDFIPDPDKPEEFKKHILPVGVTPEMCRDAIRKIAKSPYNFKAGLNREGIRWSNLPEQLPFNDGPRLQGPRKGLPLVTVMCSDLERMARNTGKVRSLSSLRMSSDRCYRS